MAIVSMKQLLEAGVHFGHQTRRWNPKMKNYIFTERNGIYIIDLQKTVRMMEEAYNFVRDTVVQGGTVLFVGTKKQAQESIQVEAQRCRMPYVNQRWLGGMLTNFKTIRQRIDRLHQLEKWESDGTFERLTKKEVLTLNHEKEKLEKFLGGIRDMTRLPDAVYIVDPRKEKIALAEARKLEIPIIAIVDTNCDPDEVDYIIPGNDDAIRAVKLITSRLADAVVAAWHTLDIPEEPADGPDTGDETELPAAEETAVEEAATDEAAAEEAATEEAAAVETPATAEEEGEEEAPTANENDQAITDKAKE